MSTHFPLSLASMGAFVLAGIAVAQPFPNPSDLQQARPAQIAVPTPSDVQTNTCTSTTASANAPPACPDDYVYAHTGAYRAPLNSIDNGAGTPPPPPPNPNGTPVTVNDTTPKGNGTAPMANGGSPSGNGTVPVMNGGPAKGNGTASTSGR